jgi:hypothetical protein
MGCNSFEKCCNIFYFIVMRWVARNNKHYIEMGGPKISTLVHVGIYDFFFLLLQTISAQYTQSAGLQERPGRRNFSIFCS